eukprot:Phypoly_transcript_24757.p1 GENE.Phypoly_transcript_24757~~Phypoly_transcript_24757.p1  ORF type:complete len:109 (+),score=10.33 Phypoly_transcript_24757:67-393(+)
MSKAPLPLKLNPTSLSRQDSGSIVAAHLLAEKEVKVDFQLPNGTTVTHSVKAAYPIDQLKALIQPESGIDFDKLVLYHNDKVLPDPLSLSDVTDVSNPVTIKVSLLFC